MLPHNVVRCPHCNRLGSAKRGGYCKSCHKKLTIENQKIPLVRSHYKPIFGQGFVNQDWNPTSFGIVKDSFGIIEK